MCYKFARRDRPPGDRRERFEGGGVGRGAASSRRAQKRRANRPRLYGSSFAPPSAAGAASAGAASAAAGSAGDSASAGASAAAAGSASAAGAASFGGAFTHGPRVPRRGLKWSLQPGFGTQPSARHDHLQPSASACAVDVARARVRGRAAVAVLCNAVRARRGESAAAESRARRCVVRVHLVRERGDGEAAQREQRAEQSHRRRVHVRRHVSDVMAQTGSESRRSAGP